MSTPHPLEEAAQTNRGEGTWELEGQPKPSSFGGDVLRSPYTILEGLGSGAAKGQAVLGGLLHTPMSPDVAQMTAEGLSPEQIANARKQADEMQQHGADAFAADARERVKALTPDAATTGTATQVLHGVASGAEEFILGSLAGGPAGAVAAVGSSEGLSAFQEKREQGVDTKTAAESGLLTAITSGAGAAVPAGFGSSLITRLLTGAASNTGFGLVNRGADHLILAANGYSEMAEQQKVWDGTQMLVDAALGATFGGVHHAMSPAEERTVSALKQNRDAALTANLALKDRTSAPGVAVDPASAQAHQAALEKALTDVVQGKPVDVSDTGIDRAEFLKRPEPDDTPAMQLMADALKESGFLDEEANLRDLEAQFERRTKGEPEPAKEPAGSAPDFMTELERKPANPNEPTERMVNGVRVEMQRDPFDEGAVHLNSIQAEEGQKGAGTRAMKELTDLADKHGVRMTLDAKPFGEHAMEAGKLSDFYKRFGFKVTEQGEGRATMERMPGATPKREAPIVAFRREAAGIEKGLPPVEEGYTRLWRGNRPGEEGQNPTFTNDLPGIALPFRKVYGGKITYVDVPTKDLAGYENKAGAAPGAEFTVSKALAAQAVNAKPISSGDPVKQALAERPNMKIPENGKMVKASDALQPAPEMDWFTATKAATDCFARRGG